MFNKIFIPLKFRHDLFSSIEVRLEIENIDYGALVESKKED